MTEARWVLSEPEAGAVEALCRDAGIRPATAAALLDRGVTDAGTARRFLAPRLADLTPPDQLPDAGVAAERLARAVVDGERIALFGDYDVDGITSTVLLLELLRALGAEASYELPRREDGYGLSSAAVNRAAEAGATLLVTVDCGSSAVEAVATARAAGLDVVVTDHHRITGPLPEAAAVLNPQREDGSGAGRELAGVGVALHLAMALRARLREQGFFAPGEGRDEPNLKQLFDLVALGTVADVVPLTGENRILASVGLGVLGRAQRPGVAALLGVSEVRDPRSLSARDVAFRLAPRINAAGRMGDAARAAEMLLTRDPQRARALAAELDAENQQRRQAQDRVLTEATRLLGEVSEARMALVVAGDGWPRGLVGLVAGRLADRHHRPAVVLTREGERCVGSARSAAPLDLHDALSDCDALMVQWGGHADAAGLTLASSRLEDFAEALEQAVARRVSVDDLRPELRLDGVLDAAEIDDALVDELGRLAPHGEANPPPRFLIRDVRVNEAWTMGRDGATLGLKLDVAGGRELRCVGFRLGARKPADGSRIDLAARPVRGEFRGMKRLELMVEDLREAGT